MVATITTIEMVVTTTRILMEAPIIERVTLSTTKLHMVNKDGTRSTINGVRITVTNHKLITKRPITS